MGISSGVESTSATPERTAAVSTPGWRARALWLIPVVALCMALGLTWAITIQPWAMVAQVGQQDSALLGPGYYTKEQTADGVAFRWTNGPAVLRVPYLRSNYVVSIRADTATGQPYLVKLLDGQRRWASFEAQPGFRTYHILWPARVAENWMAGLGAHDFTILAEARKLRENDNRIYGIAINQLAARELGGSEVPVAPLLVVGLTIVALAQVLRPLRGWRIWVLFGLAVLLPLAYGLLSWYPPVGDNHTWLPFAWLPWLVALICIGTALWQLGLEGRRTALIACLATGLVFAVLLISFQLSWRVDGPDYGWHVNHGGSWERVFRAHRFYPFAFPLILYLGQLANNNALLFGRITGLISMLALFAASVALCWRVIGLRFAWLAGALLLAAPMVVAYGVLASTDAPLAGAAACALLALAWHERPGWQQAFVGGLLLGLAYLFRFQAMLMLPSAVMYLLLWQPADLPKRLSWLGRIGRFALPVLCIAGFVIATTPQWVFDIRDFGRPFFTQQYMNIWTFGFDQQSDVPSGTPIEEIWYILSYDPGMLWRHWMGNIQQAGSETLHQAMVWPFGIFALIGIVFGLLNWRDRRFLLLTLWIAIYAAAVALTYNKDRFYLPIMPALFVCALVPLRALFDRLATKRNWQVIFTGAAAIAIWCWALLHLLEAQRELIVYLVPGT